MKKPSKIINTIEELSCGGVVYQKINQNYLFLLGKHSAYHKWVLPKGRIEVGETEAETALREIKEETSIEGRVIGKKPIYEEKYIYYADFKNRMDKSDPQFVRRIKTYQENGGGETKVNKTVKYFLVEYVSGNPAYHDWEMEDCNWFTLKNALEIVGFPGQKKALIKANQLLTSK